MRSSTTASHIIARKTGAQVKLYSHPGNELTRRFPLIVDALSRLRSRSCIIDGEAVACDDHGVASFDLVRHHRANESIFLNAFDLIELNGDGLRRDPLELRALRPPQMRPCSAVPTCCRCSQSPVGAAAPCVVRYSKAAALT